MSNTHFPQASCASRPCEPCKLWGWPSHLAIILGRKQDEANFANFFGCRLEFSVGPQPAPNLRMIERHFFKNKLVRTYDFEFGFCIPSSTNSWEAIYDVPPYSDAVLNDYVSGLV